MNQNYFYLKKVYKKYFFNNNFKNELIITICLRKLLFILSIFLSKIKLTLYARFYNLIQQNF